MADQIVALVTDLIFATKITSTARSLGVETRLVRSVETLADALRAGGVNSVLIDMNADGADPIEAICAARSAPGAPRVIGYLSHVQTDLARQARAAGADVVLPRSEFSARLPDILRGNPSNG